MSEIFPVGKLPPDQLIPLLTRYTTPGPDIVVGPGLAMDAAVLRLGDHLLVAKTDPITFATDEIGWYAVHVNANDLAALGATPRWFLATLLLPEHGATLALADSILAQIAQACAAIGASLVGGHTEITVGLDRPIVVGQMLGEVTPDRLVTAGGALPGDAVLLTKGVGIEGTAIIARERAADLVDLPADLIARAAAFLHQPGISVVPDATILQAHVRVHAMHDPTEGGVATGLYEVAQASGVGLDIDADALPIRPETQALCDHFGLDPLGLIASGGLIVCAPEADAGAALDALAARGIGGAQIGRVTPAAQGVVLRRGAQREPLPTFARDELARLFS